MEAFGRALLFGMGLTFMLLAYQVDNFTGILGWVFGVTLTLAVFASFVKPKRYPDKHGDQL